MSNHKWEPKWISLMNRTYSFPFEIISAWFQMGLFATKMESLPSSMWVMRVNSTWITVRTVRRLGFLSSSVVLSSPPGKPQNLICNCFVLFVWSHGQTDIRTPHAINFQALQPMLSDLSTTSPVSLVLDLHSYILNNNGTSLYRAQKRQSKTHLMFRRMKSVHWIQKRSR